MDEIIKLKNETQKQIQELISKLEGEAYSKGLCVVVDIDYYEFQTFSGVFSRVNNVKINIVAKRGCYEKIL